MNKKQILTIASLVFLILALSLTGIVLRYLNKTGTLDPEEPSSTASFSSIIRTLAATEDIDRITTRAENGQNLHFAKDSGGTWHNLEEPYFPVQDRVSDLVKTLASLQSSYTIWEGETLDMYGLENPVASLTYGNAQHEETLFIGRSGVMEMVEYCYAKLSDEDVVYVVDSRLFSVLQESIYGWADIKNPPLLSGFDIQAVSLEMAGREPVVLECRLEQVNTGVVTSTQPQWYYNGENISEMVELTSFTEEIRAMEFDGMIRLMPTDVDLTEFGFEDPTLVFTVKFRDEAKPDYLLAIGSAFKREESERDFYYCITNQDGSIYYMKDFGFDALTALVEVLQKAE